MRLVPVAGGCRRGSPGVRGGACDRVPHPRRERHDPRLSARRPDRRPGPARRPRLDHRGAAGERQHAERPGVRRAATRRSAGTPPSPRCSRFARPSPTPLDDLPGGPQRGRRYVEARLEAGDVVTVVGTALPFGHLADPDGADRHGPARRPAARPRRSRGGDEHRRGARGRDPHDARGCLGQRRDPGVRHRATGARAGAGRRRGGADARPRTRRPRRWSGRWDLEPDLLVVAAAPDAPLLIAGGAPDEVVAREEGRFLVGLLGAVLAIGSAIVGAAVLAIAVTPCGSVRRRTASRMMAAS